MIYWQIPDELTYLLYDRPQLLTDSNGRTLEVDRCFVEFLRESTEIPIRICRHGGGVEVGCELTAPELREAYEHFLKLLSTVRECDLEQRSGLHRVRIRVECEYEIVATFNTDEERAGVLADHEIDPASFRPVKPPVLVEATPIRGPHDLPPGWNVDDVPYGEAGSALSVAQILQVDADRASGASSDDSAELP